MISIANEMCMGSVGIRSTTLSKYYKLKYENK